MKTPPLSTSSTSASQPSGEPTIPTVKEMATALGRSEDYVGDMKRGGFRLPATKTEAEAWIRAHGPPTRFRLYSHRPSCRKKP